MKILMISSEGWPLARSGALADVLAALPRELKARGHEIALAMPFYREFRVGRALKTRKLPVDCRAIRCSASSSTVSPSRSQIVRNRPTALANGMR